MSRGGNERVVAVTVDLDDTLFPQSQWLGGAWVAVAHRATALGLRGRTLLRVLEDICAEGSDQGRIIDRALVRLGIQPEPYVEDLVAAFAGHQPVALDPYPGVRAALLGLRSRLPVVCITDGDPRIQRAKLAALGLEPLLEEVVISDEVGGRACRKPHPAAFERALQLLGEAPDQVVHIGDRPGKDVAGANRVGMRAIRVRTGEYADAPDGPEVPWLTVDTFAQAAQVCLAASGTGVPTHRESLRASTRL